MKLSSRLSESTEKDGHCLATEILIILFPLPDPQWKGNYCGGSVVLHVEDQ